MLDPFLLMRLVAEIGVSALFQRLRYLFLLKTGVFRRLEPPSSPASTTLRPLFSLPAPEKIRNILDEKTLAQLRAEADALQNGQFRIFGHFPLSLPSWDFELPRRHWAEYAAEADSAAAFLPPGFPPDIKFLWEPARWGWAFILGRAYHILAEERYAATFWKLADSFLEANPPYLGPHWMNGQEVALRLLTMLWAAQVFASSPHSTPERQRRLVAAIFAHAHRIPPTLDYAISQNNNHLISESAALIAAARALPEYSPARRWERLGIRLFNRALESQINAYGEYIQHSTNYHRLMLQIALWMYAIDASCFSRAALQNLARATHWLRSLTDPDSGKVPNLGSNDGAHFLLLTSCSYSDFRPTVQAAARAFLGEHLPYQGIWDELSLWLNLIDQTETEGADLKATHLGYMGASDVIHGRRSWGYLRATSFRSPLAHSDQLHFDLWWRGFNIARDPGSGYYNLPAPWDNPLTIARVHNTVTVDGKEPRRRLTRFMSLGWKPAWARPLIPENSDTLAGLEARYRGYPGILHTRCVWVYADEHWEVQDELVPHRASAMHSYRLHWLLADGEWTLQSHQQGGLLQIVLPIGILRVQVEANAPLRIQIIRAGKVVWGEGTAFPYEGWFSPSYGLLEPALSFSLEMEKTGSALFSTRFTLISAHA